MVSISGWVICQRPLNVDGLPKMMYSTPVRNTSRKRFIPWNHVTSIVPEPSENMAVRRVLAPSPRTLKLMNRPLSCT